VTPPLPEPEPNVPATEVERLNEQVRDAVTGGKEQPELLEQSSLGLGLSLGYFSSLAEGRTLRDDIKQYYFALLRKVNEQWWLTGAGSIRTPRIPIITVVLARNGDLVERFIEQGSGDREYDQKILQALDAAAPFPPLPPTYRDPLFKVPIRMVAPLNFLLPGATEFKGHS
jgi:TonB family protein